jgi:hypothetical protein
MTSRARARGALALAICALATACSASQTHHGTADEAAKKGTSGAGSNGPDGGSSTGSGDTGNGGSGDTNHGSADASLPPLPACVTQASTAKQVPVDMYIMLDRSGSMTEPTGAGPSKWDAIRDALTSFFGDARSDGLGVGLQYFPLGQPGVPEHCASDSDCGPSGGFCLTKACQPSSFSSFEFTLCLSDNDCPPLSAGCVPYGLCEKDSTYACFNLGANGCTNLGACTAPAAECTDFASCEVADYAKPAVAIGTLPGRAKALSASLAAEMPVGLTPTSAALAGALQAAGAQAKAEPMHQVIAVLATDGLPTQCDPIDATGVANIAAGAFAQKPPLRTYVIGVFGAADTGAQSNLDAWAKAGGSGKAFLVDPSQDVSTQFLSALEQIRGGSAACEYLLPPAPVGSELDLHLVNVALVEPARTRDVLYVSDAAHCGDAPLGWYYDAPRDSGDARKILVCKATCDALHTADHARVDIRYGCKTNGPE